MRSQAMCKVAAFAMAMCCLTTLVAGDGTRLLVPPDEPESGPKTMIPEMIVFDASHLEDSKDFVFDATLPGTLQAEVEALQANDISDTPSAVPSALTSMESLVPCEPNDTELLQTGTNEPTDATMAPTAGDSEVSPVPTVGETVLGSVFQATPQPTVDVDDDQLDLSFSFSFLFPSTTAAPTPTITATPSIPPMVALTAGPTDALAATGEPTAVPVIATEEPTDAQTDEPTIAETDPQTDEPTVAETQLPVPITLSPSFPPPTPAPVADTEEPTMAAVDSAEPTAAVTTSPTTQTCQDSTKARFKVVVDYKARWGCGLIRRDGDQALVQWYCKNVKRAQNLCKATCGVCIRGNNVVNKQTGDVGRRICRDKGGRRPLKVVESRPCQWLRRQTIPTRRRLCNNTERMRRFCPVTCETCPEE